VHVLVTGAEGMLGRDLVPYLESQGHRVTGIDLEVDITDPEAIGRALAQHAPEAVIHAAAYTNVDAAEEDESTATRVNGDGAGNVAAACARAGIPMVQVSTDYVFDGTKDGDYREDDPCAPTGAYGRSKFAGEQAVLAAHPDGVRIARTAWLYGAHGRNFIDTMRALARDRDEVTVVADQVGSPTWTGDLVVALEALLTAPPGVYHTAGGGSTSWAGLAREVFAQAGLACTVRDITTAELGRPAPRPARSVLAVTRPQAPVLRDWREALRDYLQRNPLDEETHAA